jgi:hypothetical protein
LGSGLGIDTDISSHRYIYIGIEVYIDYSTPMCQNEIRPSIDTVTTPCVSGIFDTLDHLHQRNVKKDQL